MPRGGNAISTCPIQTGTNCRLLDRSYDLERVTGEGCVPGLRLEGTSRTATTPKRGRPTMKIETAARYRGNLRFVEFSYSPRTRQFGYSDGGDDVPSDAPFPSVDVACLLLSARSWPQS